MPDGEMERQETNCQPDRDYQLGQQSSRVAGGGVREERIDLPAVLPAPSARALAQRLATGAALRSGR